MNGKFKNLFSKYIFGSDYCPNCYKNNSRLHFCPLAIIMRLNFHEQPHFVLYNYSLLSPAFFTSVTLSDWKPLSVSMDAPFLTSFFMSDPAGLLPSQLPPASLSFFPFLSLLPPSSSFYLKTDRLSFPHRLISRSPRGHFVHVPSSLPAITAKSGGPQFFSPPLRRFSSRSSRDFSVH